MSEHDPNQTEPVSTEAEPHQAARTPAEPPPVEPPEEHIARLEGEKAELHERLLRLAAEFENYKKRARRDADDAAARAKEGLLKEFLPVLDNLERALAATAQGGTVDTLVQGVKQVQRQAEGALEKFGVKSFESLGQPFDPTRHEAIQQVESAELPPGTVAEVYQRGYAMGDRLVRAALVVVSKAKAQ